MPFVRYARDRRGYETLYVMHAFEGAERAPRPRVLYACRRVPYAKVGRTTLDESVQRRLESAYPTLTFDWPKLLKEAAQSAPRPERPDPRQEPRKGKGKKDRVPRVPRVPLVPKVRFEVPVQVLVPEPVAATGQEPEPEPRTEPMEPRTEPLEPMEPGEPMELGSLFVVPSWPVVEVVGSDRALILRGRYLEIAGRVLSRIDDPDERRRLFREAGRLNPEGWRTEDEARDGVAAFEDRYAALAQQLRRQPPV